MNKTNIGWNDHSIEDPRNVDLAVVIGRFNPGPHNGHMTLLRRAEKISKNRLCLVGSSFIARDTRNPFRFVERQQMLQSVLDDSWDVHPVVDDLYNNQVWMGSVQSQVNTVLEKKGFDPKTARVALVGYRKDQTSYYLDFFPQYIKVMAQMEVEMDSTSIRENLFHYKFVPTSQLPTAIQYYLEDWKTENKEIYENLCGEWEFMREYKKQFEGLKYPPKFVCVDATVICQGHVLLIKRRSFPGKGLWALPGGHLNDNEYIMEGIIRELMEETRIKIEKNLLLASMKGFPRVFDAPGRSLRGRTISHNGLFVLNTKDLPRVKGDDDAEKARWVPLSEFYGMSEQMFEDHYSMVNYMIGRAG